MLACACVYVGVCAWVRACVRMCMYVCVRACVRAYVCVCVYVGVCLYVWVCIHACVRIMQNLLNKNTAIYFKNVTTLACLLFVYFS